MSILQSEREERNMSEILVDEKVGPLADINFGDWDTKLMAELINYGARPLETLYVYLFIYLLWILKE